MSESFPKLQWTQNYWTVLTWTPQTCTKIKKICPLFQPYKISCYDLFYEYLNRIEFKNLSISKLQIGSVSLYDHEYCTNATRMTPIPKTRQNIWKTISEKQITSRELETPIPSSCVMKFTNGRTTIKNKLIQINL